MRYQLTFPIFFFNNEISYSNWLFFFFFWLKDEDDDSDEAFEDDYFILPDPTDLLPIDPLIHMLIGGYGPRGPIPEIGIMRPTYFNILFTFLEIF